MSDWRSRAKPVPTGGGWKSRAKPVSVSGEIDLDNLKDEAPEWLSTADRLKINNLSQSPQASIKYLQEKYPDAEFKISGNEIQLRKKGTSDWFVASPSFTKDPIGKIGDNAFNIGSGLVQGKFTPQGALGSAVLKNAGMGGALEALRQTMGRAAGIPNELGEGVADTVGAAATGAGATALMGAGPQARGLVQKGYDVGKTLGRKTLGAATGIESKYLKNYGLNPEKYDEIVDPSLLARDIRADAEKYIGDKKEVLGKGVAQSMQDANEQVSLRPVAATFRNQEAQLVNKLKNQTPETLALQDELRKAFEYKFGGLPKEIPAPEAFALQQRLRNDAKFSSPTSDAVKASNQRAWGALNEQFSKSTGGKSDIAKKAYKDALDEEAALTPIFGLNAKDEVTGAQQTLNNISKADELSRIAKKGQLEQSMSNGLPIKQKVDDLQTWYAINNPDLSRTTPLSYLAGAVGGFAGFKGGGGMLGGALGAAAGKTAANAALSPAMIKSGIKSVKAFEELAKRNPEIFYLAPNELLQKAIDEPIQEKTMSIWDHINNKL